MKEQQETWRSIDITWHSIDHTFLHRDDVTTQHNWRVRKTTIRGLTALTIIC